MAVSWAQRDLGQLADIFGASGRDRTTEV